MEFLAPRLLTSAQHILQRLLLDNPGGHASGTKARHHNAVRTPQRGRVRVARQVQAVAFWQLWWSLFSSHTLVNVARGRLDHALIHPASRIFVGKMLTGVTSLLDILSLSDIMPRAEVQRLRPESIYPS